MSQQFSAALQAFKVDLQLQLDVFCYQSAPMTSTRTELFGLYSPMQMDPAGYNVDICLTTSRSAVLQAVVVVPSHPTDPANHKRSHEHTQMLTSDCELLERLKVMDYSLLLGVHYLNWGDGTWHPPSVAVSGAY